MTINLNKTTTIPAPLQPHLATFLPLLTKETLIEIVVGLNNDLTAAKADDTLRQQEVAAMTHEFEEKYYGLDLQNRKLEKRHAFHMERIANLTKRLAQAEAVEERWYAEQDFLPDELVNDESA